MSDKELIQSLKQESLNNPVLSDVLLMFSTRQRARSLITLQALTDRMHQEKFRHTKDEYARVLEILAAHKIGALDRSAKGHVRALKQVSISIPTLGRAVMQDAQVKKYRQRARFGKLPPEPSETPRAERKPRPWQTAGAKIVATVLGRDGQAIANIAFNADATREDIADFFARQLEGEPGKERSQ